MLIGKTYYDYYPKDIADELTKMVKIVLETNQATKTEEKITDVTTGKFRYYETVRAPLFGNNNEVVGTICTAIEITDKKESAILALENERYRAEKQSQAEVTAFMNQLFNLFHNFKANSVNKSLEKNSNDSEYDTNIKLTIREEEIIYLLGIGKVPKEIASILSKLYNKTISSATIGSFINKQLYPKFGVISYGDLVDKAYRLQLISFMPNSLRKFLNNKP